MHPYKHVRDKLDKVCIFCKFNGIGLCVEFVVYVYVCIERKDSDCIVMMNSYSHTIDSLQ